MTKLLKCETVSIVSSTRSKEIRRDTEKSQRILSSRFIITKKPNDTNPSEFKVKAR